MDEILKVLKQNLILYHIFQDLSVVVYDTQAYFFNTFKVKKKNINIRIFCLLNYVFNKFHIKIYSGYILENMTNNLMLFSKL